MIDHSAFDSTHYSLKVGRLSIERAHELEPALQDGRRQGYAVLFLRVDAGDHGLLDALGRSGVSPLETLVTSTVETAAGATASPARAIEHHASLGDARDLEAIGKLTAAAITGTHLHNDPRLPIERTRAVYSNWARNDAAGRAQRTLVARDHGDIVGYATVLRVEGCAVIDLIAVRPDHQARGVGSALLASYLAWARSEGLTGRVGTQSDNPVLGLYQRFGFVPRYRQCTYHLWLDD